MASASITNTFTAATPAVASEVNRNFTDLVDFANDDTVHRDGTKPFTGAMSMGSNKITNVTAGTADNDAVNVAQLSNTTPAGTITMYGNAVAPSSWLLCDGAAYSRAAYSVLFAVIGTSYGVGDGGTTFNVPNMSAKFPYGGTPGSTGGSNDAVNITHTHTMGTHIHTMGTHAHVTDIDHDHASFNTSSNGSHFHNGLSDAIFGTLGFTSGMASGTGVTGLAVGAGFTSIVIADTDSNHVHPIDVPALGTNNKTSTSVDPGDTGSTDPGDTNPTDPGDTNSAGVSGTNLNRPAFVGVTFIIKSGL